ncbi:hypothetical protein CY34DRAFT_134065 [Suillus luteus UH-Slu-Lm8-n1]|uniref:Uncharacterized protein n=1 Tax=Suillus luteus UH-Slu-Lm8-n1 TaxID=930992 RepID=A0A0D0AXU7_9AGAM|nr:hypothetical protein CY34DRAFT_134065 [Suillus luteus UH-Slu-Lm8-n1]
MFVARLSNRTTSHSVIAYSVDRPARRSLNVNSTITCDGWPINHRVVMSLLSRQCFRCCHDGRHAKHLCHDQAHGNLLIDTIGIWKNWGLSLRHQLGDSLAKGSPTFPARSREARRGKSVHDGGTSLRSIV